MLEFVKQDLPQDNRRERLWSKTRGTGDLLHEGKEWPLKEVDPPPARVLVPREIARDGVCPARGVLARAPVLCRDVHGRATRIRMAVRHHDRGDGHIFVQL